MNLPYKHLPVFGNKKLDPDFVPGEIALLPQFHFAVEMAPIPVQIQDARPGRARFDRTVRLPFLKPACGVKFVGEFRRSPKTIIPPANSEGIGDSMPEIHRADSRSIRSSPKTSASR
jgi:hypothetical protein